MQINMLLIPGLQLNIENHINNLFELVEMYLEDRETGSGCSPGAEHLPTMCEAVGSIPGMANKAK